MCSNIPSVIRIHQSCVEPMEQILQIQQKPRHLALSSLSSSFLRGGLFVGPSFRATAVCKSGYFVFALGSVMSMLQQQLR
mmetsp:Transcript_3055/g.4427  ORF Transcript_3055/g.4427 Transcript_3055/m.4427 type:complete len:80 (+) Transcript_3055:2015-2254(+)